MAKILYVASTESHLRRFHRPYLEALEKTNTVLTMATGEGVDFPILFDKHFFSVSNLRSITKIRRILKKERFDAVLLHTTLAAFLVRAAMIGMKKPPYVLNMVHGYLFPFRARGLRNRVLLACEKMLRNKTDDIAVMNLEDYSICQKYKLCRGKVYMTRGMGITISSEVPKKNEALRASLGYDRDDFVCLFVGELSSRKNQSFLISATKRLREEGFPICLCLVGEGTERDALQAQISALSLENTVILAGNQEPILPYLAIADLYVSASVSEGLPFNIMEAMSCELPIVASDVKGQNDLLSDIDGALYAPDDMEQFCEAVTRIYQSGRFGVGSVYYPDLGKYRLDAVYEGNMLLFTKGIAEERENV